MKICLQMWEDLIQKAKDGGLNVIETYVFWNVHEPSPGNYNFEGRCDLVRFIKTIQRAGLYAQLLIGPYVCVEWNFGFHFLPFLTYVLCNGFPVWLKYVPGINFKTENEPLKIENESGMQGNALGSAGYNYMNWATNMAVGLGTGVPWEHAPDLVVSILISLTDGSSLAHITLFHLMNNLQLYCVIKL
ncbi:hypothetical protein L1049_010343 [Liquidambar formosana]|uniref:beta-galactosidase n=1 Tax=Liquidambar formosana TaxID=63359 RepID=A0AAP0N9P3_LIQFO